MIEFKIQSDDRDQVIVTDGMGNDYARTISASDPVRDQLKALLDVVRNVSERIADINDIVLTGYDIVLVDPTGTPID